MDELPLTNEEREVILKLANMGMSYQDIGHATSHGIVALREHGAAIRRRYRRTQKSRVYQEAFSEYINLLKKNGDNDTDLVLVDAIFMSALYNFLRIADTIEPFLRAARTIYGAIDAIELADQSTEPYLGFIDSVFSLSFITTKGFINSVYEPSPKDWNIEIVKCFNQLNVDKMPSNSGKAIKMLAVFLRGNLFARKHIDIDLRNCTHIKLLCNNLLRSVTSKEESDVIKMHLGIGISSPKTYEEIADEYSVSCEDVMRVEANAYKKLHHSNMNRDLLRFIRVFDMM